MLCSLCRHVHICTWVVLGSGFPDRAGLYSEFKAGFFPQEKKGGWHRALCSSAHDMFFSLCFTSGGFAGTLFNPKLSNAK